jgi:soluble lytic murein transglycosylase-like protein
MMLQELLFVVLSFQQDEARKQMEESIARQMESVQKQTGSSGFFSPGFFSTTATPDDCPALTSAEVEPMIASAAETHKVDAAVVRAVMRQESAFRPCVVSAKGAVGLMQLMPATSERFGVQDSLDPAQNVDGGARYLKELLARFKGDLKLALAAYNAGPEKVDGKVPEIPETKAYVTNILKALDDEKEKKP